MQYIHVADLSSTHIHTKFLFHCGLGELSKKHLYIYFYLTRDFFVVKRQNELLWQGTQYWTVEAGEGQDTAGQRRAVLVLS